MRKLIEMSEQEKSAHAIAQKLRLYGEQTNQPTYSFLSSFYTLTTETENGDTVDVIRFKAHSFRNLLNEEPPGNIISRSGDKLLIAFQIGLHKGEPVWNVPS